MSNENETQAVETKASTKKTASRKGKKKKSKGKTKTVSVKATSKLGLKRAAWKAKLAKHKKDRSYYVKYFVEVSGKRIPLKDAYRAIFSKNASNEDLDSSRILAQFQKMGITVYTVA